jgi:hypothetical protein
MRDRREKASELLKALGFLLLGFVGGFVAKPFIEGFWEGFNQAREERAAETSEPRPTDPEP